MGRSGCDELQLGMRPGLSVLTPSLLLTFCRRISVLDVAGADVSPSILVLWACKLGCSVPSSAMRGLGRVCWWCCGCSTVTRCFRSHIPVPNNSKFLLVIKLLLFLFSSGSYIMQSHFLDCQGIRSAKNGRWVLVLLRKNTQQGKRGALTTSSKILGYLTPCKYLRMMWHRAYTREF